MNVAAMLVLFFRLLVVLYVLPGIYGSRDSFCPVQNTTASPQFTTELGAADWVRYGHFIPLLCCAEGYDSIKWYRIMNDNVQTPLPSPDDTGQMGPDIHEHGQVLEFYEAGLSDEGLYLCNVIKDGNIVLNHTIQLYVLNCDIPSEGPRVTEPAPLNQTIDKYGGTLTLYCTGYFGCQDSSSSLAGLALWSVLGSTTNVSTVSPRYHVAFSDSEQGAVKQATLTISNVAQEDTERTFICTVASPQLIKGQTHIPVRITKRADKPSWLEIGLIVGGCIVFMLIIMMLVVCIRCLCGPQVRLFFNRIVPKFGPKYIDDANIEWNVYIYHADEDENIATQWKNILEKFGYKVRIHADMTSGKSRLNDFKEATTKSALVVFLYSENLLADDLANLLLTTVVMDRNGKDIMFLEKTDFKPKEIREWAREARNKDLNREVLESIDVIVSIEEDVDNSTDDEAEDRTKIIDDLKFWKIIPRFKVPKDGASQRVTANFVCSLRNNIPRFREPDRKENVGRKVDKARCGSGKPLLDEEPPESPLTPVGIVNQNLEMSPNMSPGIGNGNRFDYNQTSVMKIVNENDNNTTNGPGTTTRVEIQNPDNDVNGNPHGELYVARIPSLNKDILIDAVVHEAEINNVGNYTNGNPVDELIASVAEQGVEDNGFGDYVVGELGLREQDAKDQGMGGSVFGEHNGVSEQVFPEQGMGESTFGEQNGGEHGVSEHNGGEHGVIEHNGGEHGVSEHGISEHGFGEHGMGESAFGEYIGCEHGPGDHGIREHLVSKPELTEQAKETIFTMSGEEEPKNDSLNTESAFTSSGEESSRGDNVTSDNDEMSSQNASSVHSSSGFGSQSSDASSPPIIVDQSLLPRDVGHHLHTNGISEHTFVNVAKPLEIANTSSQFNVNDNPTGRDPPVKDGKHLKVTINEAGRTGSGSSPESGYITTSPPGRYTSAGAFLPQVKETIG